MRLKPSSPTMGPSGVVNVVASALARNSRTLEAFRASGHATVQLRGTRVIGGQGRGFRRWCEREGEESARRTGIVEWFARFSIPEQGRLSLSGDPDSLELVARVALRLKQFEASGDALVNLGGVDGRIVFVPARFRVHCVVNGSKEKKRIPRISLCERGSRELREPAWEGWAKLTLFEFDLVVSDDVCPLVKDVEPARSRSAVDSAVCRVARQDFPERFGGVGRTDVAEERQRVKSPAHARPDLAP